MTSRTNNTVVYSAEPRLFQTTLASLMLLLLLPTPLPVFSLAKAPDRDAESASSYLVEVSRN